MSSFASTTQVVCILDRALQTIKTQGLPSKLNKIRDLDLELQSLLRALIGRASKNGEFCEAIAITIRHVPFSLKEPSESELIAS